MADVVGDWPWNGGGPVEDDGKLSGSVLFYLIEHKPDGSEGRLMGDSGVSELRKLA